MRYKVPSAVFCAAIMLNGAAGAQHNSPLVGAWQVVSINDERSDGSKVPQYGPNPSGLLMFDAQGRYSLQLCAEGRPKYAAKDRTKGTPEEYTTAAKGCNPHWGRYVVDTSAGVVVFKIEHALFPNWEGTEQRRSFVLSDGMLKYSVPNPAVSGTNPVVVWKRAE